MGPKTGVIAIALLALACGKTDVAPPVHWYDVHAGERKARRTGMPAVVFVHAEWSAADKQMEQRTFAAPEVRAAMKDFVAISVDVTDDESEETKRATERFGVLGVPTVIVIDDFDAYPPKNAGLPPYTNPKDLVRWNEYVEPPRFAEGLRAAKAIHDERARRR